jgi:rSAM/selenodomain-associated transferase 2
MTVSVIIPTLNEAVCLPQTLQRLRAQKPHEVIVSDGGSTDATLEQAGAADRVILGSAGRAAQMNRAATEATGDVLLFLHADCSLEDGALITAEQLLGKRGIAAGCYRMTVADPKPIYRLIDWCATARVRLTGLIYGDQGLFVERRLFQRIGGFPPLRLMEDVFISKSLNGHGRIVVAPQRIVVSPRRWKHRGVVSQTLRNWTLTALAAGGVHPDRLAAWYPMVR